MRVHCMVGRPVIGWHVGQWLAAWMCQWLARGSVQPVVASGFIIQFTGQWWPVGLR